MGNIVSFIPPSIIMNYATQWLRARKVLLSMAGHWWILVIFIWMEIRMKKRLQIIWEILMVEWWKLMVSGIFFITVRPTEVLMQDKAVRRNCTEELTVDFCRQK